MNDEYVVTWVDEHGAEHVELFGPNIYENPLKSARELAHQLRPHMRGTVRIFRANADVRDPRAMIH